MTTHAEHYRAAVWDSIESAVQTQTLAGGDRDGEAVAFVTVADLARIKEEIEVPRPTANYGEVRAPASITVEAPCPQCGIASPILVRLLPHLSVDPDGADLSVKAKGKARPHLCGQLVMEVGPEVDGQQTLPEGGGDDGWTLPAPSGEADADGVVKMDLAGVLSLVDMAVEGGLFMTDPKPDISALVDPDFDALGAWLSAAVFRIVRGDVSMPVPGLPEVFRVHVTTEAERVSGTKGMKPRKGRRKAADAAEASDAGEVASEATAGQDGGDAVDPDGPVDDVLPGE